MTIRSSKLRCVNSALGLLACAFAIPAGPGHASSSLQGPAPRSLDAVLEPIRDHHDLPALAAGIISHGVLVAEGATGQRKLGSDEAVTTGDRWHLGSCTKAITATLLAKLVDEGQIDWSTTVATTFPDLREDIAPGFSAVTLEQLLHHRSGLPEDRTPDLVIFPKLRSLRGPLHEQRRELLRLTMGHPPAFRPGSKMQYANAGYVIAAAMAEEVTGHTWEELVTEKIFEPLHMSSAGFGPPGGSGEVRQPRGHRGKVPVEAGPWADNPPVLGPAGAVHASLGDWAKFIALQLAGARRESRFLRPETFAQLQEPAAGQDYAMGWAVTQRDWADGRVLTHAGSNGMWFAVVWIAPEKDLAVLAVTNTGGGEAARACDEAVGALIQRELADEN